MKEEVSMQLGVFMPSVLGLASLMILTSSVTPLSVEAGQDRGGAGTFVSAFKLGAQAAGDVVRNATSSLPELSPEARNLYLKHRDGILDALDWMTDCRPECVVATEKKLRREGKQVAALAFWKEGQRQIKLSNPYLLQSGGLPLNIAMVLATHEAIHLATEESGLSQHELMDVIGLAVWRAYSQGATVHAAELPRVGRLQSEGASCPQGSIHAEISPVPSLESDTYQLQVYFTASRIRSLSAVRRVCVVDVALQVPGETSVILTRSTLRPRLMLTDMSRASNGMRYAMIRGSDQKGQWGYLSPLVIQNYRAPKDNMEGLFDIPAGGSTSLAASKDGIVRFRAEILQALSPIRAGEDQESELGNGSTEPGLVFNFRLRR